MVNEENKNKESYLSPYSSNRFSWAYQWLVHLSAPQPQHEHHGKSIWQKIGSFFSGLFGKKKKHHHSSTTTPETNSSNVVNDVLNGKTPTDVPPKEPTTKTNNNNVTTVDLGDEQKPVDVQLKIMADEPNAIMSSSNADDYKFIESRNVDGVEKEANLDQATKDKIAKVTADVERDAYYQTAKDMGFEIKEMDMGNGQTKYLITDPNNGNRPITAQQMEQFRTLSIKNFNSAFNDYYEQNPDLGFKLYREIAKQPGLSGTVAEEPTNTNSPSPEVTPTPSKDIPSKDTPKKPLPTVDTGELGDSKSPSSEEEPNELPTLGFAR